MPKRDLLQVDAFSIITFTGKPAGVLYPYDGQAMLHISRELNNSKTACIWRYENTAIQCIRFYTQKQEMALCTHATVVSCHVLATELGLLTECKSAILAEAQKNRLLAALQIVSTGNAQVLVGLKSKKVPNVLVPIRDALIALGEERDAPGFYLYTFGQAEHDSVDHARMLRPDNRVEVDSAIGNATAALALYLNKNTQHVKEGELRSCKEKPREEKDWFP